ncbi:DUF6074 family protein [Mesorhizobium sp. M0854]|uniref:DUF6074 family protein n=1 Tax=Mesorhizobium sp. M0854 TaxID=2957013 RepID=UPI00333D2066
MSAFPLNRRRKLVEGIARVLESENLEDANAFWRSTAKTILVNSGRHKLSGRHAGASLSFSSPRGPQLNSGHSAKGTKCGVAG